MPAKKHIIHLTTEERAALEKASHNHRLSHLEKTRARILLSSDTNCPREEGGSLQDGEVASLLNVSPSTVPNVRRRAQRASPRPPARRVGMPDPRSASVS